MSGSLDPVDNMISGAFTAAMANLTHKTPTIKQLNEQKAKTQPTHAAEGVKPKHQRELPPDFQELVQQLAVSNDPSDDFGTFSSAPPPVTAPTTTAPTTTDDEFGD
eukprot:TRINITY_DN27130_c0_g1_i1.p1 TRINITY_DN27130_c0_g1~~TRINITY_DN27130_c0_g1_i1.p1  ORF type:complete len:106 (+),score=27.85 TRINITY_DN27130_c0_g1_i1:2-319(+)